MRRKKIEPDLQILFTTYLVWQGLKDDYQTYRELNSLQGVCGNMILLEYYSRDFT